jgi:hypothetical protein
MPREATTSFKLWGKQLHVVTRKLLRRRNKECDHYAETLDAGSRGGARHAPSLVRRLLITYDYPVPVLMTWSYFSVQIAVRPIETGSVTSPPIFNPLRPCVPKSVIGSTPFTAPR